MMKTKNEIYLLLYFTNNLLGIVGFVTFVEKTSKSKSFL